MVNRKRIPKLQKLLSHYDSFANLIGCQANCTHHVVSVLCSAVSEGSFFLSLFSCSLQKISKLLPPFVPFKCHKGFSIAFRFRQRMSDHMKTNLSHGNRQTPHGEPHR